MQNLLIKVSLPGTEPLVWREVVVSPRMDLEDLHYIIQAVMYWDNAHLHHFQTEKNQIFDPEEEVYYGTSIADVLPRKGSKLWYVYDFGDNWENLIEVVDQVPIHQEKDAPYLVAGANASPPEDSGGIPGYRHKLDILADPAHPDYEETLEWLTGVHDKPFDPLAFDLEDFALYLQESWDDDLGDFLPEFNPEMEFLDLDLGQQRKINFTWLEQEHGLLITDEPVRNEVPAIVNFLEKAEQEDDPTPFLAEAELLCTKYPNNYQIRIALAAMYSFLGKDRKAGQILKNMPPPSPDDLMLNLTELMMTDTDADFVIKVKKLPQPLDLNNLPAGKGNRYHSAELLLFEDVAIRFALAQKKLDDAIGRLDRLVQAGYQHNDVRSSAMMVAAAQITKVHELMAQHQANPDSPIPPPAEPLFGRTQEIIDNSMQDVLQLMEGGGLLSPSDDWDDYDEDYDDFPALSLAHSARQPQPPFVAKKKIGRNEPCPCGSGRKYKACCLGKG